MACSLFSLMWLPPWYVVEGDGKSVTHRTYLNRISTPQPKHALKNVESLATFLEFLMTGS